MGDLSEHFSKWEFRCKCGCGLEKPDPKLIKQLEFNRNIVKHFYIMQKGIPGESADRLASISIASGCRCVEYNFEIGGAPNSAHLLNPKTGFCEAADPVAKDGEWNYSFLSGALLSFKRVGHGEKDDKTHFHVDVAEHLPRPRLWGY